MFLNLARSDVGQLTLSAAGCSGKVAAVYWVQWRHGIQCLVSQYGQLKSQYTVMLTASEVASAVIN